VAAVEQPAGKLTELVSEIRTNARPAYRAGCIDGRSTGCIDGRSIDRTGSYVAKRAGLEPAVLEPEEGFEPLTFR
jgi:hypothetical protein